MTCQRYSRVTALYTYLPDQEKEDKVGVSVLILIAEEVSERDGCIAKLTVAGSTVAALKPPFESHAALGDRDEAFRILENAVADRSSFVIVLKEDPPLEPLHSDPRWARLLEQMNFPPG